MMIRDLLLNFLQQHYKENPFRKQTKNETEVDDFLAEQNLQQCHVSGALAFLEQKLKDVAAAIQFDMDDNEYTRTCRKQKQIKSAIQLISELSANDG